MQPPSPEARRARSDAAPPPCISVVIPVRNDSRWLGGAIDSVLAQTYDAWELIIGDNASSEDLAALVRAYDDPRIRYHHWTTSVGVSENHNRTMALSRYEWIQVLSADDRLRPGCLARIAEAIAEGRQGPSRLAMVLTACRRVDVDGRPADIVDRAGVTYRHVAGQRIPSGVYTASRWLCVNAASGVRPWMIGSVAIARDLVWETGGFRPEMGLCDDLELSMRLAAYGDVIYLDEPLLDYTVRPDSMTAQLEDDNLQQGGSMSDVGAAWLAALQTHEHRRRVSDVERGAVHAAIARAFLRRALLQRRRPGVRARWLAVRDVLRAMGFSPSTVLGGWRAGVALAAVLAPRWLLERATRLGHRRGLVVV